MPFRYSGSSPKAKVIPKGSEINRRAKGITNNRSKQDKNLRTIKRQTMAREITDLHGNKFRVGDYKLCLNIPITGKGNLVFTRDLISGEPFNLSVSKKNIGDISITYL